MKKLIFAALLIAIPVLAAEDPKPLPPEAQIKLLKTQRSMQSLQMEMTQLQLQFDKDTAAMKQFQADLLSDCTAATKAANLDPEKFTCDLNAMTIVAKPAQTPPARP